VTRRGQHRHHRHEARHDEDRGGRDDLGRSPNPHRLYRNPDNGVFLGVCAGIADYLGIPVWQVRVGAVVLALFFLPQTVLVYLAMGVFVRRRPRRPLYSSPDEERFWRSVSGKPDATFHDIRHRFRALDSRLARLERHVTSDEYALRREFEDMEKGSAGRGPARGGPGGGSGEPSPSSGS